MQPSRRRVLSLGATLLAAGCVGSPPSGSDDDRRTDPPPATAESTAKTAGETDRDPESPVDDCVSGVNVSTDPFDPVSDLAADLSGRERTLIAEAIADGTATYTTYARPPLSDETFVARDGAFYRIRSTVASVERVPAFETRVEWERGQSAPADADVVPFDDLPAVDREMLRGATLTPEHGGLPQQSLSVRNYPAPYPDSDASRLVGNATWVAWRDRTFRVEVAGESTATRERRTHRYAVERVAATPAAFRRFVADAFLVELDGAPPAQRRVVESALDGGYEECAPPSDALAGLRERLARAPTLPDASREWYAALGGRRFRLVVRRWEQ